MSTVCDNLREVEFADFNRDPNSLVSLPDGSMIGYDPQTLSISMQQLSASHDQEVTSILQPTINLKAADMARWFEENRHRLDQIQHLGKVFAANPFIIIDPQFPIYTENPLDDSAFYFQKKEMGLPVRPGLKLPELQ